MSENLRLQRFGAPDLAYALSGPSGKPRGAVLVLHGYADHMGRYREVVARWNEQGLLVATFDLRGHGASGGKRGWIDSFDDYCRDTEDVLHRLDQDDRWKNAGRPVLFGHSLGGLVACHVALARPGRFAGLALSSPFFETKEPVPRLKVLGARLVRHVYPGYTESSDLRGADMTHDKKLAALYDTDPLNFHHVAACWYLEVSAAQRRLLEAAPRITLPVFCMAAGDDRVVDIARTREVFEHLGTEDKELRVLEGQFHEILNEVGRAEYISTFGDQMLRWVA